MRARSADELEAALAGWTDRVNNYPYADVHGNFGYVLRGRIPKRGSVNGWGPVPGWSGDHDWQGMIEPSELPRTRNPACGWAVTCNQRVVGDDYPYFLTNFFGPGFRAERVAARIEALGQGQATIADMCAIHTDVVSIPAQSLQLALRRASGLYGSAAKAAQFLLKWDASLARDSAPAALYQMTAHRIAVHMFTAHYGSLASNALTLGEAGADDHWRRQLKAAVFSALEKDQIDLLPASASNWTEFLQLCLSEAVERLEERLGVDWSAWRWDALHRTNQKHPLAKMFPEAAQWLNPPSVGVAGDSDTPMASGSPVAGNFLTGVSAVNRYAYDPSDWKNSRWLVPLGASGHPASANFTDQQSLWVRGETVPVLWEWEEIGREARSEQQLSKG